MIVLFWGLQSSVLYTFKVNSLAFLFLKTKLTKSEGLFYNNKRFVTINISRHFYTFILFCFTSEGLTKKTTTKSCRNHEIHDSSERGIEGITFGLKVICNLSEFGSNLHNTVNQWPAHLVIPQPNQDDVWRVDPNLQGNKRHQSGSRWVRCPCDPPALCDPPTWAHTAGWESWHHAASGRVQCLLCGKGKVDPSYLFPEFSSDVAKALGAIKAHGFQTSIPQHLNHLSVLWRRDREEADFIQTVSRKSSLLQHAASFT